MFVPVNNYKVKMIVILAKHNVYGLFPHAIQFNVNLLMERQNKNA